LLKVMKENWDERKVCKDDKEKKERLLERMIADNRKQYDDLKDHFNNHSKIEVLAHGRSIQHYAGHRIDNC